MLTHEFDDLLQRQGAHLLAALLRQIGDLGAAQDALDAAANRALTQWAQQGVPPDPIGWMRAVAQQEAMTARAVAASSRVTPCDVDSHARQIGSAVDPAGDSPEDWLCLLMMCCHPLLSRDAQIALTLRSMSQWSTRNIARALGVTEPETLQTLSEARLRLSRSHTFESIEPGEFADRQAVVLSLLAGLFDMGHSDSSPFPLIFCSEAIRLAREVASRTPAPAEALGLLALLLFKLASRASRFETSTDDRDCGTKHRRTQLGRTTREASLHLERALVCESPGPYQLQAAIAALQPPTAYSDASARIQISVLYEGLLRPMTEARAVDERIVDRDVATSVQAGLTWLERIAHAGRLGSFVLLHAARADLLNRLGRFGEAAICYRRASSLAEPAVERNYYRRALTACLLAANSQKLKLISMTSEQENPAA